MELLPQTSTSCRAYSAVRSTFRTIPTRNPASIFVQSHAKEGENRTGGDREVVLDPRDADGRLDPVEPRLVADGEEAVQRDAVRGLRPRNPSARGRRPPWRTYWPKSESPSQRASRRSRPPRSCHARRAGSPPSRRRGGRGRRRRASPRRRRGPPASGGRPNRGGRSPSARRPKQSGRRAHPRPAPCRRRVSFACAS